jgi:spore coat polysaccharide biosynthesis predicted glycosyltransferase SpsG
VVFSQPLSGRALTALSDPALGHLAVDLVIGANHPQREVLAAQATARPNTRVHGLRPHLADLMAADGIIHYLGPQDAVGSSRLRDAILQLATDPARLNAMSQAGAVLVDGQGAVRVSLALQINSMA